MKIKDIAVLVGIIGIVLMMIVPIPTHGCWIFCSLSIFQLH